MKKSYLAVILIFGGFLFLTFWLSVGIDTIGVYLDIPSVVLILVFAFVPLLATYSLEEMRNCFVIGFRKSGIAKVDIKNAILFFSSLQKYLILSGLLGTSVGTIALLTFLGSPGDVGKGMAMALLTAFYAVILSIILAVPFKAGLQKRLNEMEGQVES